MLFIRVFVMSTGRWNVGQFTTYCLRCLPRWWRCYSINLVTWILRHLAQLWHRDLGSQAAKFQHFSYRHWRELFSSFIGISSSTGCKIFIIIRLKTDVIKLALLAFVQKTATKKCLLHHTTQNHLTGTIYVNHKAGYNYECTFFWYQLTQIVLDKGPLNGLFVLLQR